MTIGVRLTQKSVGEGRQVFDGWNLTESVELVLQQ